MARVLYAWELGAALGHVGRALMLAKALAGRGHETVFAMRDPAQARAMPGLESYRILQAPLAPPARLRGKRDPVSYADVLAAAGFLDPDGLAARVRAWRSLFDEVDPRLVVADHAPTALLACRGLAVKRALYGSGFFSPPRISPFPSVRPWRAPPVGQLVQIESEVLASVNRALESLGVSALGRLCDLYDADEDFLCTLPELDHFPERGTARYWGPIYADDVGDEPEWPAGNGARVFAYLQPKSKGFERLVGALSGSGCRVLLFAPGLSDEAAERFRTDSLLVTRAPLRIAAVARQADLGITHAGPNTATALLTQRVPLILLPQTAEQMLFARRVRSLGAGLVANMNDPARDFKALLAEAVANRGLKARAAAFAARHAAHMPATAADAVAEAIERLLERGTSVP